MNFPVLAITLDLDDTLWPFAPIGARIDQVLHDWMLEHSPATARMYPVAAMRELRERSFRDNPHLHYDLSALRRLTLAEALEKSGASMDLLDPAYETFYAARNQVEFYPDALAALRRIAACVPVAAVSNGNAVVAGQQQHAVGGGVELLRCRPGLHGGRLLCLPRGEAVAVQHVQRQGVGGIGGVSGNRGHGVLLRLLAAVGLALRVGGVAIQPVGQSGQGVELQVRLQLGVGP